MTADTAISKDVRIAQLEMPHFELFQKFEGAENWHDAIKMVPVADQEEQSSDQRVQQGRKAHPFVMQAAIEFKNQNPHHSTCIEAKSRATCGLGFKSDKVADELDELCDGTFQDVINAIGEDYWQVGNGYMEVTRNDAGKIVGLHHISAPRVHICIENNYTHHFEVCGENGTGNRIMAPYGELQDFLKRLKTGSRVKDDGGVPDTTPTPDIALYGGYGDPSQRSEIIHFPRRTSMNQWYGYPDWLSAIAVIELMQCLVQERYDFFQNRGVPEFFLFLLGKKLDDPSWSKIERAMQATIGKGNQHKSLALNIPEPDMEIQVEKLAMDGKGDTNYTSMAESLALDIVTAHRTPPLLAGIQIPGKLGAVNELPNALLAFQVLVIGPEQNSFQSTLGATLGNTKLNGGLGVRKKDFEFKKITEEIPLGMGQQQPGAGKPGLKELDTMGRMRTPAASANGRDLSAGVKKEDLEFVSELFLEFVASKAEA